MPPNAVEIPDAEDPESVSQKVSARPTEIPPESKCRSKLEVFLVTLNTIVHILMGLVVGIAVIFALTMNFGPTPLHIILCTIGFQLLMAQSILSLYPHNTWSSRYSLVNKRRIHWVSQILGSGLIIAGCIIISLNKEVHWNTLHGQFGLVAMVFTTVSLVNGLASLYAYELRKFIPGILSKLTHICFGTVAFTAACVSLCYGFDKNSFRTWTSNHTAQALIGITGIFNALIIINPLLVFSKKIVNSVKSKFG